MKKEAYTILRLTEDLIFLVLKYKKSIQLSRTYLNYRINVNITNTLHTSIYISIEDYNKIDNIIIFSLNVDNIQPDELNLKQNDLKGTLFDFDPSYCEYDINSSTICGSYLKDQIDQNIDTCYHEVQENNYEEWAFQYSLLYDFVPSKEDYFYVKDLMNKFSTELGYTFANLMFGTIPNDGYFKTAIKNYMASFEEKIT